MNHDEMARRAQDLFLSGFHCSQAIFTVGTERLGVCSPEVTASLAPFGGGLGSTGDVCGCLAGALAAIGLTLGKKRPGDRDHRLMWKMSYKMVRSFHDITAEYGGHRCADIARINWKNPREVKAFRSNQDSRRSHCLKVIGETTVAMLQLLETMQQEEYESRG